LGGLGKCCCCCSNKYSCFPDEEEGGDIGQAVDEGDEVDVKGKGWLVVEELDGEIDKLSIECAMLVCEFEGRIIETGLDDAVDVIDEVGGDIEPYLGEA
jgi:hypothetical protein